MGDRTNCSLNITGELSSEKFDALRKVLDEASDYGEGANNTYSNSDPKAAYWYFDEVNYGEMPSEVREALEVAGVSWSWGWDAGGGYPAGLEVCIPSLETPISFATSDGEIVLTLREVRDLPTLIKAFALEDFLRTATFTILDDTVEATTN